MTSSFVCFFIQNHFLYYIHFFNIKTFYFYSSLKEKYVTSVLYFTLLYTSQLTCYMFKTLFNVAAEKRLPVFTFLTVVLVFMKIKIKIFE